MKLEINDLLRENIKKMMPYSSARKEYVGNADIFLDANENPYHNGYNRYPDPTQQLLKNRLSLIKNIKVGNIFIGNGSDEIIDLMQRAFCEPKRDAILVLNPSYTMYSVCASLNDIQVLTYDLDIEFGLNPQKLLSTLLQNVKLIFICSPNNPSGNDFNANDIIYILENFEGIVVVDEAYKDFSNLMSMVAYTSKYENLVVMQTLSKAYGIAGLRLGIAYSNCMIIDVLNKIKPPYNINAASQSIALKVLENKDEIDTQISKIVMERDKLSQALNDDKNILKVYHSDANFILVKVKDALSMYQHFVQNGIILRNRHGQLHCDNCLRITIGTEVENLQFLETLKKYNG